MQQAFWMLLKCCWLICVAGVLLHPKHDAFWFWDVFVSLPEKKPGCWLKNKQRFGINTFFPDFGKGKTRMFRDPISTRISLRLSRMNSFIKMEGILQAHRVAFPVDRDFLFLHTFYVFFSSKWMITVNTVTYFQRNMFSSAIFCISKVFFSTKFAFWPCHLGIVTWHKSIAISAPQVMEPFTRGK